MMKYKVYTSWKGVKVFVAAFHEEKIATSVAKCVGGWIEMD